MKSKNSLVTKTLLSMFAIALLGACSKANDAATGIGGQPDKDIKALELRSEWKTTCNKSSTLFELFGVPSQTTQIDFGASHSATTVMFREENCQTPAIRIVENGSYNLGDKVADNIYQLNQHYNSVTIVAINDDGMNTLNTVRACGFNDWKVGQPRDVTPQSSTSPILNRCWIKTPRDVFDIVLIKGTQIKFGLVKDGKDRSAPDKRPTQIDEAMLFAK